MTTSAIRTALLQQRKDTSLRATPKPQFFGVSWFCRRISAVAALDSNFAALYLSGGLLSYRNIAETENYTHPFANFLPGILLHTDLTELPGPKCVVLAGAVDAAGNPVPVDVARTAYSKASNVEVVADARWDTATLAALSS